MYINLRVVLNIEGNKVMREGSFLVNQIAFRKRPDYEAARVACKWIDSIKSETGYRKTEIVKATYNEENDITGLVIGMNQNDDIYPDPI